MEFPIIPFDALAGAFCALICFGSGVLLGYYVIARQVDRHILRTTPCLLHWSEVAQRVGPCPETIEAGQRESGVPARFEHLVDWPPDELVNAVEAHTLSPEGRSHEIEQDPVRRAAMRAQKIDERLDREMRSTRDSDHWAGYRGDL